MIAGEICPQPEALGGRIPSVMMSVMLLKPPSAHSSKELLLQDCMVLDLLESRLGKSISYHRKRRVYF